MSRTVARAAGPLWGSASVPGDKSIGHRALLLGALAEGTLNVRGLSDGQDVRSTRSCLEALGVRFEEGGRFLAVHGAGAAGLKAPARALDCGNSGSTMRFLMGVLAGQPFESELTGDASLSRRPMERVAAPLRAMGADITLSEGHAPVRLRGRRPLKGASYRLPVASAQVKTALLLAGLYADGETTVEDPFGTRDHTELMLAFLGADCRSDDGRVTVRPGALRSGKAMTVPGDPSSAAFLAAAAVLVPGSRLIIREVLLNPTRLGFFEALREMGAPVSWERGGLHGREVVGDVTAAHGRLKPCWLDAARVPGLVDEVPLLAVLCAFADGESRLEGLAELRVKESDRLAGTAAALTALGASARVDGDALVVAGPARWRPGRVETLGDHRLAMASAVAALAGAGPVELSDADCAAVSYPSFFDDVKGLGA
ncbi:MAG: 3-phosphoshikimate 1-carboxyvinyltransferase [Elusimicrobia bacterium]|nr:3-phosphoshikimate 1-carboxyvinyltransferase [Elusimicrobiota bacterium]